MAEDLIFSSDRVIKLDSIPVTSTGNKKRLNWHFAALLKII
jgi:hypothetical protein